jgi:hypothetical protein
MGAPLGQSGLHRRHRLGAFDCLYLVFLVYAQHHGFLGRVKVEPDDVGDLADANSNA